MSAAHQQKRDDMSQLVIVKCPECGQENLAGYTYCSGCKRPRLARPRKEFSEFLWVNVGADCTALTKAIYGPSSDFQLTPAGINKVMSEAKAMNKRRLQALIRRYQLNKAGTQPTRTYADIAKELDIVPNSIRTLLYDAFRLLRKQDTIDKMIAVHSN
jgi:hypothetical protein